MKFPSWTPYKSGVQALLQSHILMQSKISICSSINKFRLKTFPSKLRLHGWGAKCGVLWSGTPPNKNKSRFCSWCQLRRQVKCFLKQSRSGLQIDSSKNLQFYTDWVISASGGHLGAIFPQERAVKLAEALHLPFPAAASPVPPAPAQTIPWQAASLSQSWKLHWSCCCGSSLLLSESSPAVPWWKRITLRSKRDRACLIFLAMILPGNRFRLTNLKISPRGKETVWGYESSCSNTCKIPNVKPWFLWIFHRYQQLSFQWAYKSILTWFKGFSIYRRTLRIQFLVSLHLTAERLHRHQSPFLSVH